MITMTVLELTTLAQSGVLKNFLEMPKPVKVGWENRGQGPRADAELRAYGEGRLALLREVGATLPEGEKVYAFPEGSREKFDAKYAELLAQVVELPGSPVSLESMVGPSCPDVEAVLVALCGKNPPQSVLSALDKLVAE